MKKKFIVKISIDFIMTIILLLLMARQITGESAHEWLGAGMMVLWVFHHVLNGKWYGSLFKGKYTFYRVLQVVTDIAVLLSMFGLMISGIILSREVFAFLPISGKVAFARSLHVPSAFWGFVLMAFHLGLHWNMILGMVRRMTGPVSSVPVRIGLRIAAAGVAVYGVYAFMKNEFTSYMFLKSSFVFFDFEKPTALFFIEYVAIMGLFIYLAHYVSKGLGKMAAGRRKGVAGK